MLKNLSITLTVLNFLNFLNFLTFLTVLASISKAEPNSSLMSTISQIDADVVFMRHALAPGFGDPVSFELEDCNTQRNLDASGRNQAQLIGRELLNSGIHFSEILSSEWCRCKETASLLNIGKWRVFSGLNSFFQDYADKEETLNNLNSKLTQMEDGVTLMISHQIVIRAITGSTTQSGELVVFNSKTMAFKNILLN
jgi:phosphohistidine phosphatase SixA